MDGDPTKIALMIRWVSPRWYRYNEGHKYESFELRVGGECFFDYQGPSQREVFCRGMSLIESAQEPFNLIEMGRKGYSGGFTLGGDDSLTGSVWFRQGNLGLFAQLVIAHSDRFRIVPILELTGVLEFSGVSMRSFGVFAYSLEHPGYPADLL